MPTCAVVVPIYNAEAYLEPTLISIEKSVQYAQEQSKNTVQFEIITVLDGCTDKSEEIVSSRTVCSPCMYRIIKTANRGGGASCMRNIAVRFTKADIFLFCDSDDFFLEHHVYAHAFGLLKCLPEFIHQVDGKCIVYQRGGEDWGCTKTIAVTEDKLHQFWADAVSFTIPLTLGIHRCVYTFLEGFPEQFPFIKYTGDDVTFMQILKLFFKIVSLNTSSCKYTRRPGNSFDKQMARFQSPPDVQHNTDFDEHHGAFSAWRSRNEKERADYLHLKLENGWFDRAIIPYLLPEIVQKYNL